jgi:hypothetical protein
MIILSCILYEFMANCPALKRKPNHVNKICLGNLVEGKVEGKKEFDLVRIWEE